jgi:hypothetical protein
MAASERIVGRSRVGRTWKRVAGFVLLVAATVAIVSQWVRIILRPEGDFARHYRFGQRFIAGTFLYEGGLHKPYPPFWGMASSFLTVLPMPVVRVLTYPIGPVLVACLLWILHRLTRRELPLARAPLFWSTALAVLLSSRFLIRELPECGANLLIVTLVWTCVFLWIRGREIAGGACLGLAIALKCTPALFLAYFAWKRQWRLVGAATCTAVALLLAPLLRMGSELYVRHMAFWTEKVWLSAVDPDPLRSIIGDVTPYNLSLKPALGRLLIHLPPSHKGYCTHPWHADLFDLEPAIAGRIVSVVMLGLLAAFAVLVGRNMRQRGDLATLWECAAVSILMLLYSPITWRQHCVAVLPACYLIGRTAVARGGLPRWMWGVLGCYVLFVLLLDRGVIGLGLTLLLDSYGVTAWALLALLAVTLGCRVSALRASEGSIPRPRVLESHTFGVRPVGGVSDRAPTQTFC